MTQSALRLTRETMEFLSAAHDALEELLDQGRVEMIEHDLEQNAGKSPEEEYFLTYHCQEAAEDCDKICALLGADPFFRYFARLVAELHDIGKTRRNSNGLFLYREPRRFNDQERDLKHEHEAYFPIWIDEHIPDGLSEEALAGVDRLKDGGGNHHHPDRAENDDVGLATLILFATDIAASMLEKRPGRGRGDRSEAYLEVERRLNEKPIRDRYGVWIAPLLEAIAIRFEVDLAEVAVLRERTQSTRPLLRHLVYATTLN